jgi:hypothetical protein
MPYKVSAKQIRAIILKSYFSNEGDVNERIYWPLLGQKFPNCELFWRLFVIPFTKRIESEVTDPNERIREREGISPDVFGMGLTHYSMFLNLVYAQQHFREPKISSFEDCYVHLGSACDLAEAFLCKVYLITLECSGVVSQALRELAKADFLKFAEQWFDLNYSKAHHAFVVNQKPLVINLVNKVNLLDEYFRDDRYWGQYKSFTQLIRQYRNIIVHDTQIGRIINLNGIQLVPLKEKISTYKVLSNLFLARNNPVALEKDFADMKHLMFSDIEEFEGLLNQLWTKPLNDLTNLFYKDKNELLWKKYNLTES